MMGRRQHYLAWGLRLAVPLLLAQSAYAASADHGHHEVHVPVATLIFSTINLLIFGYILARFAAPAVSTWVRERRSNIVRELEEAATARGEALRLKAEWENRLAKLQDEIESMRAEARQDMERERERILAAAHAAAAAMCRDAERLAAAEARQLEADLRAEVARKAVALAEQKVRAEWNSQDQERQVGDFLRHVQA